jgi:DNA-binding cell septation regulator SpoVG
MKIKIYLNQKADSKKKADAAVLLEEGDGAGLLLRGFNVWEGKDGLFVTPPNQTYNDRTGKKKYFHHIKSEVEGALLRLNDDILEAYNAKLSGSDNVGPDTGEDGPF